MQEYFQKNKQEEIFKRENVLFCQRDQVDQQSKKQNQRQKETYICFWVKVRER